ncbi:MAG: amidohydrolase family protein [Phycisphaerae bacterium]|nr:amidohydrolase family protein [Phycisphaerae bacterium]
MKNDCYLFRDEHVPKKAALPAIDAHNHMWTGQQAGAMVELMDSVGVVSYCDLTPEARFTWEKGGVGVQKAGIEDFLADFARPYPGRFYAFTTATFLHEPDEPLFSNAEQFVKQTVELLGRQVRLGARGLKILKGLGLSSRDAQGNLVAVDDPRLADIWDAAGELSVPVLIHQSDPYGFFEPVTPENEHYGTLMRYSDWQFASEKFPGKMELLERRDNLVRRHSKTTFVLAHVANFAENLGYVSSLLDENPNAYIDFSARIEELGRQPYSAREFFIRYQDRILFGADMPASAQMYRCYFRFLETFDEYFFAPDYDGTFDRRRWAIYGIGLPREVLAKIYYQNALKIIPGLKEDLKNLLPLDK